MRLPAGPDLTVSLKPAADALAGGVERQNNRILIVSTFCPPNFTAVVEYTKRTTHDSRLLSVIL